MKKNSQQKRCDHGWCYEHTVFGDNHDRTIVRRFCPTCGLHEVGIVKDWRTERKGEFDHAPEDG